MKTVNIAILLSGGRGSRMNSTIPKQYMELCGKKVLSYSLETFEKSELIDHIIIVAAKDDIDYCRKEIVDACGAGKVRGIVAGGRERYDSVYNGLTFIRDEIAAAVCGEPGTNINVFIHDGARPMLDEEILKRCCEGVEQYTACAAGVPSKDTVKICDETGRVTETPDRRYVWNVQTPQTFRFDVVLEAYDRLMREKPDGITDDAMVVEHMLQIPVYMVMGDYRNIKITTPEDLITAAGFLDVKINGQ